MPTFAYRPGQLVLIELNRVQYPAEVKNKILSLDKESNSYAVLMDNGEEKRKVIVPYSSMTCMESLNV